MKRNLLLLFLIFLITIVGCVWDHHRVHAESTQTISITSSEAPSGSLNLGATLYLPYSGSSPPQAGAKYAAVVLVHGSGPQNRDESVNQYPFLNTDVSPPPKSPKCGVSYVNLSPFSEIGRQLSKYNNMIVLTYDKRGCCVSSLHPEFCSSCTLNTTSNQFVDSCYHACASNDIPQKYNLNVLTLDDYAMDAYAMLNWLSARSDVNSSALNLLGHSEGVGVVIRAQNIWNQRNPNKPLSNVFLMNGLLGYNYGTFLVNQNWRNVKRWQSFKDACVSEGGSSDMINAATNNIATANATYNALVNFFPKFENGQYPVNAVYSIGGLIPGTFLNSSFFYTSNQFAQQYLLTSNSYFCSLNSPSDLNIQPAEYQPLVDFLGQMKRSTSKVLQGVTHFDTPADLSSNTIRTDAMQFIQWCLCAKDGLCTISASNRIEMALLLAMVMMVFSSLFLL
ncbi:hypothetical protein FDP41_002842 [Naegleria fowleri]|uniref:AB hydrolase-1 domain-containing protein n=1 Tax=Naegleria fowleri TaxID=5763 RepID=A0A6A5BMR6_NAEFO|nr:uncharacterized protein FDP41_002842 [Naegleria fowleri]KAF0978327.1 hypothetical protein FDP41_002842 [Naegleria fowleri]CAG4718437.1 unnamed protein product [Naegleria fowleri]